MNPDKISDYVELNNGVKMPWLGLGAWQMNNEEVENAMLHALEAGYRSIDTASIYGNEPGVGNAQKKSGLKRGEIFITSKVWNSDQGYEFTLSAFSQSLSKLQTDYLDLYLIHWPVKNKFTDTWRALEKLYEEKLIRAIGVSNFMVSHLEELFRELKIVPAVNQIEFHPHLAQPDLIKYCERHLIQVEAWSPIMKGNIRDDSILKIAERLNKTPAQIVLRWHLQQSVIVIPKSSNKNRIIENSNIFDFELSDEEMKEISSLDRNYRFGPNPHNFNF